MRIARIFKCGLVSAAAPRLGSAVQFAANPKTVMGKEARPHPSLLPRGEGKRGSRVVCKLRGGMGARYLGWRGARAMVGAADKLARY